MAFKFSTGDTVEIEVLSDDEHIKHKTLVDSGQDDDYLVVHAPMNAGKILLIQMGEKLKLFFPKFDASSNRYDIYSFKGVLETREIREGISMMGIRRISEISKVQRRDYFRLNYVKKMKVIKLEASQDIEVLTKDVSAGGMRFITNKKFSIGEKLLCHLALEDHPIFEVSAKVVGFERVVDSMIKYDVRLRFIEVDREIKSDMIQQINVIQSTYLKKMASTQYEEHLSSIMAPINVEKLERYNKDVAFDSRLGYLKGIACLGIIVMIALFFFSRPTSVYPVARFFNIIYRNGWNLTTLYANISVGALVILLSLVGIFLKRRHYDNRKNNDIVFSTCAIVSAFIISLTIYTIMTLS